MDPMESQSLRAVSQKSQDPHSSSIKPSIPSDVTSKQEPASEGDSGWGDVATWLNISELVKGAEKFTAADDLPTMLWPGIGYELGASSEVPETEKDAAAKHFSAEPNSKALINLTPSSASSEPMNDSNSYQGMQNRSSRSFSVSAKGSTLGSQPFYEGFPDEIQNSDILWPGPVIPSHASPIIRTRTTSVSESPNTTPKSPLSPMLSNGVETARPFNRLGSISISKPQISEEMTHFVAAKTKEIELAIQNNDRVYLQKLGLEKLGFINSSLRSDAWCILLHSDKNHEKKSKVSSRPHDSQIDKECSKAFLRYPSTLKGEKRRRKQKELAELLKAIFQREPKLSYYQGFRDVAACFLLVLGKRKVANAIQNAALFYFRDMMLETLGPVMRELAFGFCLIKLEDPMLHSFLVASQVQSYYGLSGILTWFSHASNSLSATSRIFDTLLSSDPIFSVYLLSAATLHSREEILQLNCERSEVHTFLSQIPLNDIEELVSIACTLFKKHPPASIQKTSKINIGEITCTYRYEKDWNSINTTQDYIRGYDSAQEFISQVGESRKANVELKCGSLSCEIEARPTPSVATSILMRGSMLTISALVLTYCLSTFSARLSRSYATSAEKPNPLYQPADIYHSDTKNPIEPPSQPSVNIPIEEKSIYHSFVEWLPSSAAFNALRQCLAPSN